MNLVHLNKSKFVLTHLIFWVGVWFFYVYFFSYNSNNTSYVTWFSSFLLPITMVTSYFVIYYLIPRFLLAKKYFLFTLYSLYTLVFSTYLILIAIFGSLIFLSNLEVKNMPPMSRNYIFILILVYLVVTVVSFVSLLNHSFEATSKNKILENKILETQLQSLKKQIHPHFLFNTLNTIYGFALKQSESTPEIILKLSNLLDYILYQVNKPKVFLKDEIEHIQEYVDLEKIRFQETLAVNFNKENISETVEIAPMLLIPFVENAFKHGSIIEGQLKVNISIKMENDDLFFSISNSFHHLQLEENKKGIGLENIKKRLELLYLNQFDLQTKIENNLYEVNLWVKNLNPKIHV